MWKRLHMTFEHVAEGFLEIWQRPEKTWFTSKLKLRKSKLIHGRYIWRKFTNMKMYSNSMVFNNFLLLYLEILVNFFQIHLLWINFDFLNPNLEVNHVFSGLCHISKKPSATCSKVICSLFHILFYTLVLFLQTI